MGTSFSLRLTLLVIFFLYATCHIPLSPSSVTSSQTRLSFFSIFFFLLELHLSARAPVSFW